MLRALANGETNAAPIAALAVPGLRATPQELCDALSGAADMRPLRRQILKLFLERLQWIESQMDQLDQSLGAALRQPQDSVTRLAEVPGLGADAAQQIMAAVGPHAVTFPWAGQPASWVGCCPGREESAEVCRSDRSPKGSRHMRRILNQGANAAVKAKGSVFENLYRRLWPQLGHAQAIWAGGSQALSSGLEGPPRWNPLPGTGISSPCRGASPAARRLLRDLRRLGYQVQLTRPNEGAAL